ncbi:uncharacterized protein TrAFT101_001802 [Trichoderma asperellum]|uniref:uncharacterized protein n=1 Tax=Trichoderma asperellum TaxID=101201 RepID=UPI00332502EF|nr:hypothetical protein TrAFT101_001802 [Trichoderma asperellum]
MLDTQGPLISRATYTYGVPPSTRFSFFSCPAAEARAMPLAFQWLFRHWPAACARITQTKGPRQTLFLLGIASMGGVLTQA